jgi:hypothetical protein
MSYQTGTASSPVDLLQKLVTWLAGLGWNTDKSAADGVGSVGWRAHLDLHGNFVHLRAFLNEGTSVPFASNANSSGNAGIALYLSTAFNTSVAWNVQPGSPPFQSGSSTLVVGCGMALPSGAIQNYFFFADATFDNIVVVVEKTPGVYVYIGWGLSIQKAGTITGGPYFFGSSSGYYASLITATSPSPGALTTSYCPCSHGDWGTGFGYQNGYFRADVDSFTGKWLGLSDQTGVAQGYTGKNAASPVMGVSNARSELARYATGTTGFQWQFNQTSSLDGRANLLPLLIWAARDTTPGGYSPIGVVPNIFFCTGVGQGFSNAQEITLGAVTYKLFPSFAIVKQ